MIDFRAPLGPFSFSRPGVDPSSRGTSRLPDPSSLTILHQQRNHSTEAPLGLKSLLLRSMASKDPYPSPPQSPAKAKGDPILRNTLRYTISAKEYKTLHEWFISRSPQAVRKRAPTPHKYASLVQTKDDYNGAAIRASLRVFIAAQTSLQLWELIKTNLLAKRRPSR